MIRDDCIEAQRVLNEASDGVPVGAEELKQAKAHCAACSECLSFVSGLAALKKAPEPVAPEGLADSVIAAVNAEAERVEAERAAAAALAAEAAQGGEVAASDGDTFETGAVAEERSRSWKTWAPWAAAAAAGLIVVFVIGANGVRYIAGSDDSNLIVPMSESQDSAAPAAPEASGDADNGSVRALQETEGAEDAKYVTHGEYVYSYRRTTQQPSNATTAGAVVSSLDSDEPPQSHPAFTGRSSETLIVFDGNDYLEFDLVKRGVQGRTYAMVANPVNAFGMWPLPPQGLPMPTNDDGSPVFRAGSLDSNGAVTYVPVDEYPREGVAIAPDTSPSDPAAGNPNWTWWEEFRSE